MCAANTCTFGRRLICTLTRKQALFTNVLRSAQKPADCHEYAQRPAGFGAFFASQLPTWCESSVKRSKVKIAQLQQRAKRSLELFFRKFVHVSMSWAGPVSTCIYRSCTVDVLASRSPVAKLFSTLQARPLRNSNVDSLSCQAIRQR